MSMTPAALLEEALALPEEERATLAEQLLDSVEGPMAPEIEAAWVREAQDRMAAYRRGEMASYPADQVLTELRNRRAR